MYDTYVYIRIHVSPHLYTYISHSTRTYNEKHKWVKAFGVSRNSSHLASATSIYKAAAPVWTLERGIEICPSCTADQIRWSWQGSVLSEYMYIYGCPSGCQQNRRRCLQRLATVMETCGLPFYWLATRVEQPINKQPLDTRDQELPQNTLGRHNLSISASKANIYHFELVQFSVRPLQQRIYCSTRPCSGGRHAASTAQGCTSRGGSGRQAGGGGRGGADRRAGGRAAQRAPGRRSIEYGPGGRGRGPWEGGGGGGGCCCRDRVRLDGRRPGHIYRHTPRPDSQFIR